jgi:hypothetical protein
MKLGATSQCVQPDGRCHAAGALVHGCDEDVPESLWSCDVHAAQLYLRGQALRAEGERKRRHQRGTPDFDRLNGRGRTGSVEKVGNGRGVV